MEIQCVCYTFSTSQIGLATFGTVATCGETYKTIQVTGVIIRESTAVGWWINTLGEKEVKPRVLEELSSAYFFFLKF